MYFAAMALPNVRMDLMREIATGPAISDIPL